jgi:hypothetical protein
MATALQEVMQTGGGLGQPAQVSAIVRQGMTDALQESMQALHAVVPMQRTAQPLAQAVAQAEQVAHGRGDAKALQRDLAAVRQQIDRSFTAQGFAPQSKMVSSMAHSADPGIQRLARAALQPQSPLEAQVIPLLLTGASSGELERTARRLGMPVQALENTAQALWTRFSTQVQTAIAQQISGMVQRHLHGTMLAQMLEQSPQERQQHLLTQGRPLMARLEDIGRQVWTALAPQAAPVQPINSQARRSLAA